MTPSPRYSGERVGVRGLDRSCNYSEKPLTPAPLPGVPGRGEPSKSLSCELCRYLFPGGATPMELKKLRNSVSTLAGKAILFLVVAGVLSGTEHLLLVWIHPRGATELAVRQFERSDSVAESL